MNARRLLLSTTAAAGALALGTLSLTACGGISAGADDGRLDVVTSFYPLEYLAEEIGGEHVAVESLTPPGTEPHDLELSPRQVGALGEADLVVYLRGFQPAVDEAVEQSGVPHVAEVSSFTTLKGHDAHPEPEQHPGHEHSHTGDGDPHLWLDPIRYSEIAEGVGDRLAKADPEHRAVYERNTDRVQDRIQALHQDFTEGLKNRSSGTFLTTHTAFSYLAERYGLHAEALTGVDPESGAVSGARMRELHSIARQDRVSTIFSESGADDTAARTLADDLGLRTDVLHPLETVRDPDEQDYFSLMRQNLTALRTALTAT